MNLYPNWRMPDVYVSQGPDGEERREEVLQRIKERIFSDIARTMTEKLADGRRHDSSTNSATLIPVLRTGRVTSDRLPPNGPASSVNALSPSGIQGNLNDVLGGREGVEGVDASSAAGTDGDDDESEGEGEDTLLFRGRRRNLRV